jgi:hypothetical protein
MNFDDVIPHKNFLEEVLIRDGSFEDCLNVVSRVNLQLAGMLQAGIGAGLALSEGAIYLLVA